MRGETYIKEMNFQVNVLRNSHEELIDVDR